MVLGGQALGLGQHGPQRAVELGGGHRVRVKRTEGRVKAEYDDAAAAAAALGRPLRAVLAEAEGLAAQDG